ncbi:hypothetical protein [Pseudoalteromonas sp. T1lg10]|uniref:hypothetical protein n=1 Tax=Pseudoalteromonas sp. T1lg10 TaxID=2077093 RepID=UPI000CF6198E|nr:hypothetical protein [Pseudoalteromonas sp. T1lg10]
MTRKREITLRDIARKSSSFRKVNYVPARKKSLGQLRRFWVAIGTPILVASIVASIIAYTSSFEFCGRYHCFNDALTYFKVPLGILAIIFPSVALVVSHHRSVQTLAQITQAEQNNTYNNYIKHQEEFRRRLQAIESKYKLEFESYDELYAEVFSENSPLRFSPQSGKSYFTTLKTDLEHAANVFNRRINNINSSGMLYGACHAVFDDLNIKTDGLLARTPKSFEQPVLNITNTGLQLYCSLAAELAFFAGQPLYEVEFEKLRVYISHRDT